MWFRNDLRLSDNPALDYAAKNGEVMAIYIFDEKVDIDKKLGAASKWWLHHSLESLNKDLNGKLNIYQGDAAKIIKKLHDNYNFTGIYWNRRYEPLLKNQDTAIKKYFHELNVEVKSFNAALLFEPHEVLKDDKTPYKVFTHYYRKGCLQNSKTPRHPIHQPKNLDLIRDNKFSTDIKSLELIDKIPWHQTMEKTWKIGEKHAQDKLHNFIKNDINNYKIGRDFPSLKKVSQLSPHLHFGEISPHQIWHYTIMHYQDKANEKNLDSFLSEIGWREFSYYLLYHFSELAYKNFQPRFDNFPWHHNQKYFLAWQKGLTGYPIVDAGMRELWHTGYMHNRVRMIVGSFLVKNLLIDWRYGEKWFWDCLVDADLASNSASWQWVAGSGADAAPYFRVFNPVLQGEKFDPEGEYTKKYLPQLAKLPAQYLFNPSAAPKEILKAAQIELGKDYPFAIVDIDSSRNKALEAFKKLKITNADKLH